ncbi:hypothetical protein [Luteimonas mephitis]|uniref:hypothetical protein n=1 Tax=Luteimonas mephitis TaxID=83615 RepID=UPI00055F20F8|nr:hypothetical protein [Luteimonas mephitis]
MDGVRQAWRGRLLPLGLVLLTVAIQLVAAWILDVAAKRELRWDLLAAGAVAAAVVLNGLRFLVWGFAHRRFPLSLTYPFTALFFPLVLMLSYWRGEAIAWAQIGGTMLITLGVALMAFGPHKGKAR